MGDTSNWGIQGVTLIESPEKHDVSSIFWSFVLVTRKWLKWLKWLKKVFFSLTEINQLMVHWWFGLLVWIPGIPENEGDCYFGLSLESN